MKPQKIWQRWGRQQPWWIDILVAIVAQATSKSSMKWTILVYSTKRHWKNRNICVGGLTCLIFTYFYVPDIFLFWGETTVNCQLFGAFPTTSRFFFTSLQNSQAVNGSWLRPCRTLPWPKAAGGQVKRWWLLSMEFAGFLENLFVPLGGKVLNILETTSGEGRSEARWFNDWLIKFVCVCVSRSFFWCFTGCWNLAYREFRMMSDPTTTTRTTSATTTTSTSTTTTASLFITATGKNIMMIL